MNDQSQIMGQSQILPNQNYAVWSQRPPPFPPDSSAVMFQRSQSHLPIFNAPAGATKPTGRGNWKGNKPDKRKDFWRNDSLGFSVPGHGYKPSNLNDLQAQNRLKGRRFHHPKKKFNTRFAPYAPRNTTSFLIRAKKSGGIASMVSPCPVTPAVLPTPIFSPSREVLVDMAKEEWGVDGYGSMKGLIRLRSGSPKADEDDEDDEDGDGGVGGGSGGASSDSDVEERVEVEKRLDHDLSRFEMIYPNSGGGDELSSALENRVDEQDSHIAQLEEENLTLKERIFLMEREMEELRRRVQCLETDGSWRNISRDRIGALPENAYDDIAGDVCSEKSVGNGHEDGT